jgi:hypothetical protein
MCKLENIKLVFVCQSINYKVALSETSHQDVTSLARYSQRMEWLVCFEGVSSALKVLVPKFKTHIERTCQKF